MTEWSQPSSADVMHLLSEAFAGNKEADVRARALIAAHITSTLMLNETLAELVAEIRALRSSGRLNGVDLRASGNSRESS